LIAPLQGNLFLLKKGDIMNTQSLTQSLVGFDSLFLNVLDRHTKQANYPPFNLIKTGEGEYCIELAVTGFNKEDLNITVEKNILTVSGKRSLTVNPEHVYLHSGLAARDFTRQFALADFVEVSNVTLQNGLLTVMLTREMPAETAAKVIQINTD
jgi:molecular chaperone IbpA